jgi:release factor H-coupled RctB family protein
MNTFDTTTLPAHARLIANPDVWMEGDGVAQFGRTAGLPGCVRAVGMPDLHVGKGPVGAVFATAGRVYPHLLGGDVGCGVRVVATREDGQSRDAIERRVRRAWDEAPLEGCDGARLFAAVWSRGLRGLAELDDVPDAVRALALAAAEDEAYGAASEAHGAASEAHGAASEAHGAASEAHAAASELVAAVNGADAADAAPSGWEAGFEAALGSVGGGNHFVEIARVDEVRDRAAAEALGLVRGRLVVVAHSGSRGLGMALARRWGDATLEGAAAAPYLADLAGACRFARVNRFLLAYRMLRALGAARGAKIAGGFDVTHNDVREERVGGEAAWVHRKGAAPAHAGAPTIVLGSRGAPSWVLRGTGEEAGLRSVAHGAGRRMGRAEALSKLKAKYRRAELLSTKLGGRVVCDDTDLLYEEHPDAYKPIEPVVASLLDAGLATAVASLVPVVTVKR